MTDLWSRLAAEKKPIIIYGMGDGADKIIAALNARGLDFADVFASDGFVRGQSFHGKRVMTYREIKEKYGDFNILLSFASCLPDVLCGIYSIAAENPLFAPDVPVRGDGVFDAAFYSAHKSEFDCARECLYDVESKRIFDDIISYKLSGDISFLKKTECTPEDVLRELLSAERYRAVADVGAYVGDTVAEYKRNFPNLEKVYAVEPDRKNLVKLMRNYGEDSSVEIIPAAAWSGPETLSFDLRGNRNSAVELGGKEGVAADSLDNMLGGRGVDYIKYDVEGAEYEALCGSEQTVRKFSPDLCVSVYHRNEDLYKLVLKVRDICPEHKLYLRRFRYIPAWDLNLYAIK